MKGIAHFISGVTVASFCPWAISAAQEGNPAYFILGAVAGILPDTIDFKFVRYFYPYDIRVEPARSERLALPISSELAGRATPPAEPNRRGGFKKSLTKRKDFPALVLFDLETLDPQPIADAVARAVSLAADGTPTTLKLSTIQRGADNWRQYRVKIDPEAGEVRVQFGPVVSTGQVPQPNTLPDPRPVGTAKFSTPILQSYEPTYTVDIFDGPSFKFTKNAAGQVEIDFLPWHRNGSHSLTVGLLLAGIASLWTWHASVIIFGAYVIHIIEDQLGHMGSNLFFPFSKKRTPGLKWMHSGDAFANFTCVWLCCLLIFWNVYAAIPNPLYPFTFVRLMMVALVIPFAVFGVVRWFLIRTDGGEPDILATFWDI